MKLLSSSNYDEPFWRDDCTAAIKQRNLKSYGRTEEIRKAPLLGYCHKHSNILFAFREIGDMYNVMDHYNPVKNYSIKQIDTFLLPPTREL